MVFDGGPDQKLRVVLEHTRVDRDMAVPFMFGRGASNYTVRNTVIEAVDGKSCHEDDHATELRSRLQPIHISDGS